MQAANFARELKRRVFGGEVWFGRGVGAKRFEVFNSQYLLREDVAELAGGLMCEILE